MIGFAHTRSFLPLTLITAATVLAGCHQSQCVTFTADPRASKLDTTSHDIHVPLGMSIVREGQKVDYLVCPFSVEGAAPPAKAQLHNSAPYVTLQEGLAYAAGTRPVVKSIRIIAVATGTEFLVVHSGGDSKDSVSTVMVTESGDPKRPAVRVTVLESRREYQLKVGQGLVAKKGEEPKIIENHGLDAVTGREAAKVFEAVRKARGLPPQIHAESDMPVQNPD